MTSPFAQAAAMWNQRYSGADYLFGREPNDYLRQQAPRFKPGGRMLCVADGERRNSVWLAQQGLQVAAFDIAETGVAKANKLAAEAGVAVDCRVADCEQWPWVEAQACFDGVVAVFIQFADPLLRARRFANMARALKPGGLLLVQGYTPRQLDYKTGGPGELSHLYTADLLRDAFAALQTIDLVEYEAALSEGARHSGQVGTDRPCRAQDLTRWVKRRLTLLATRLATRRSGQPTKKKGLATRM